MTMENFKEETYRAIERSDHKPEDVMFIGSKDGKYRMTLEEFNLHGDFLYENSGWGKIATDLIVYFTDKSYMVRSEDDESEGWTYQKPLSFSMEQDKYQPFKILGGDDYMWDSVADMNIETARAVLGLNPEKQEKFCEICNRPVNRFVVGTETCEDCI